MNKKRIIIEQILNGITNVMAGFILYMLIWTGSIMGLIESGNEILGWLLFFCGISYGYKQYKTAQQELNDTYDVQDE